MDGVFGLVGCSECALVPACGMVCTFKEAVENFFCTLERYSLADIMAQGRPDQLRQILASGARPPGPLRLV
ncbi:MAG TPA: hypothetical protein VMV54_05165 [Acidocella sp.]|nr:hypothetical protein [Acidocella sp.]